MGCSAPGHLHTEPSFCRAHGNMIHGGPAGALVSSPYSAAALNALRAPRRVVFFFYKIKNLRVSLFSSYFFRPQKKA